MAIIKKFNKALNNIGGDLSGSEIQRMAMSLDSKLDPEDNLSSGKSKKDTVIPNNIKVLDPHGQSIQKHESDESFDSEKFSQAIDAYSKHHASERSSREVSEKRDIMQEMTASLGKI